VARTKDRDGIEKRGPRYYRVVIELDADGTGKRQREYHQVHGTLEDAKKVRAKLVADKARGVLVGRSDQRLADYLESWLEWKRPRVSRRTHERYCSLVRSSIIPALGSLRLQQLTSQHLDDFYVRSLEEAGQRKESTLSATTVHHRHVALKMALKRAVEKGLIVRNPADFATPPPAKRQQLRVLDETEAKAIEALLAADPEQLPALVALKTGARLGEILAMRWTDLDLGGGKLSVRRTLVEPLKRDSASATWYSFKEPKNGRERVVDLSASAVELLKAHKKAQSEQRLACGVGWTDLGLVFTGTRGEPCRPSSVSTRFRDLAAKQKLDGLRFHDLRHSHATIMLRLGVPPHVVSQRLGHSTVAFTLDRYGHVLPGQQMDAAEAFDRAVSGA
jgi:integrase